MASTSTTDHAHTHADPSSIHLTYTIQPPPEAPQPANTPSHKSLSVPIDLPLSSTPGAPFSSRQSETAYLSALADSVLKVEMWDGAATLGPTLVQHEFYTMKNLRMRVSHGGYLEAKCVEQKITLAADGSHFRTALIE